MPKSLSILTDQDLATVQKPAQYLGGELGAITKDETSIDLHVCLAFPDAYEVGMSHVGLQILYDLINRDSRIWAERVYCPLEDMEKMLRQRGLPLCSLEAQRKLSDFDVVGFSLQYELCATGVLQILDLGGIPQFSKDRGEEDPIVIGGGPFTYHPEPFADFFDAFLVGDGEELVPEFMQLMLRAKTEAWSRAKTLEEAARIQGIYVPSFFEAKYSNDGKFAGMTPKFDWYPSVRRRVVSTLEGAPYPEKPLIPNIKAVHDRLSVEVMRGCVRGCRFCQAGYLYRPQRERKPEDIIKIVENSLKNSGFEELSLLSLSTADYCSILPLLAAIKERFADNDTLAISFPSTRVDALKPELLQEVQSVRRSSFTIAPEAGTQRLRDVINKGVSEEELMETCRNVFKLGWSAVKMYFMIGLPTETDEDVYGIIDLGRRVKQIAGRHRDVVVSVSTLVPKPHTPFQWAAQMDIEETRRKQRILRDELKKYRVTFRFHEAPSTYLEGIIARGDRRLGSVLKKIYDAGARFEGWVEKINPQLWADALAAAGLNGDDFLKEIPVDAPLPWDHISCDIDKRYFLKEWQRAIAVRTTPDCLTKTCSTCGACDYDATRNVLWDRKRSETRMEPNYASLKKPAWNAIINAREMGQTTDLIEAPIENIEKPVIAEQDGPYALKEYLKTETDRSTGLTDAAGRPSLPIVQRIRCRYHKRGVTRFNAHLELASIFFRAARRAQIPIAFSRGFNPKPKMSFGPPLQLGLESLCEYVDFYLHSTIRPEQFRKALNQTLPNGLKIIAVQEIDVMSAALQDLMCSQTFEAFSDESAEAVVPTEWRTLDVTRVRKNKSSKVALETCVSNVSSEAQKISFGLNCGSSQSSLKPVEVLQALCGEKSGSFTLQKTGVEFRQG